VNDRKLTAAIDLDFIDSRFRRNFTVENQGWFLCPGRSGPHASNCPDHGDDVAPHGLQRTIWLTGLSFRSALSSLIVEKRGAFTAKLEHPAPWDVTPQRSLFRESNQLRSIQRHFLKEIAMENYIWLFVVAGGALALGAALAFAVLQRRLTSGEKQAQDEKVERLYDKR
jgi:hypothetical protein